MLFARFPYKWGAPASTSTATVSPIPVPPFWTPVAVTVGGWSQHAAAQMTPRFEHLYPQQDADQKWVKET